MWHTSLPYYEFVIRAGVVYVFMLLLLRFTGKRQVGQLAPFDLILLLVLSNAIQNSMNGGDNSVTGGFILAITLVSLNWLVGYATYKSKTLEGMIEGRPIVLIHNGHVYASAMKSSRVTHHELNASLRSAGCSCASEVRLAMLENNGNISVIQMTE